MAAAPQEIAEGKPPFAHSANEMIQWIISSGERAEPL